MKHQLQDNMVVIPNNLYTAVVDSLPHALVSDILHLVEIEGLGKVPIYQIDKEFKYTYDDCQSMIAKYNKPRYPMWVSYIPLLMLPIDLVVRLMYGWLNPESALLTILLAGVLSYLLLSYLTQDSQKLHIANQTFDAFSRYVHLEIKEKLIRSQRADIDHLLQAVELYKLDIKEIETRYGSMYEDYHKTTQVLHNSTYKVCRAIQLSYITRQGITNE